MKALDKAQHISEQLVTWRRYFHRHPELGFQEHHTAAKIAAVLENLGYAVQTGIAYTGVVGLLENGPGPVVMARFDMDALPIQEMNDVAYASENTGVMHACGHDAHIAIGLGIATLMVENRDAWQGTLKLVFQPGEEGMNGAEVMVNEGVLENPRPDAVLALHVWNSSPAGSVAATPGPVMASAQSWQAKITGKGGHAAQPQETIDPIVTAALGITALQTIVSRNIDPLDSAVITVGQLLSGDTFNVIPDNAELKGTIRTFKTEVREMVEERLRAILHSTAQMMGAEIELDLKSLSPAVENDPQVTQIVQEVIKDVLGPGALTIGTRTMASEDAAFFLREIPGCYFFVGSQPEGEAWPHHNPRFDIDERALLNGTAVMFASLCRLLMEAK
ncbi:MAG: amidohydrolase [Anaerolineae bacterium]|nr:amidohydrolase [Anaerolineae bacterium]